VTDVIIGWWWWKWCREKVGKWFIQLCGTTPCMINGAEEIKAAIEKHLGIKEGGKALFLPYA